MVVQGVQGPYTTCISSSGGGVRLLTLTLTQSKEDELLGYERSIARQYDAVLVLVHSGSEASLKDRPHVSNLGLSPRWPRRPVKKGNSVEFL